MRKQIKFTQEGIAWTSDHGTKFKNPAGGDLTAHFNGMCGIFLLLVVLYDWYRTESAVGFDHTQHFWSLRATL